MGYDLFYSSVKLDTLNQLLNSKDQKAYDSVFSILERHHSESRLGWLYYPSHFPQSVDELKGYWQKYLHRIIFEGKIYDLTDNKVAVFRKYDEVFGFPVEHALKDVFEAIFALDPEYGWYSWTSHHEYIAALEALERAKLDSQALIYWKYLCEGRAFGDGYTGEDSYYAYLTNAELSYLITEIDKKYWDITINIKSIVLSADEGVLDIFREIIEASRDLFVKAG